MSDAVGWYGKLPTLGDFASRRLEPAFVEVWDHWLAAGLARLREGDPDGWLDAYLASTPWRFVLLPGVLPGALAQATYAGVLMPSVDRVGRYFPLTLACALPQPPRSQAEVAAWLGWLHRLDDVAVDALHDDWDIDELEAQLGRIGLPDSGTAGDAGRSVADIELSQVLAGDGTRALIPAPAHRNELAALLVRAAWPACTVSWPPCSLWVTEAPDVGVAPRLLAVRGLPDLDAFAQLFGGVPSTSPRST